MDVIYLQHNNILGFDKENKYTFLVKLQQIFHE